MRKVSVKKHARAAEPATGDVEDDPVVAAYAAVISVLDARICQRSDVFYARNPLRVIAAEMARDVADQRAPTERTLCDPTRHRERMSAAGPRCDMRNSSSSRSSKRKTFDARR
jgi:hypothetical protein